MKHRCRALMPRKAGSFLYHIDAVQCHAFAFPFDGKTIDEGGDFIPCCEAHRIIYFMGGSIEYVNQAGEVFEAHADCRD